MGKVILIMDNPKNCIKCPLGELNPDCEFCYGAGKDLDIMLANKKPDWCPLRELPDKKEVNQKGGPHENSFIRGFNACIDAILRGGAENVRL